MALSKHSDLAGVTGELTVISAAMITSRVWKVVEACWDCHDKATPGYNSAVSVG